MFHLFSWEMDSCWISTHETWVNEFDSKITQLNPDIHITNLLWKLSPTYQLMSLRWLSNEWFIRDNTWWGCANGFERFEFNYGGNSVVKRAQAGVVLGWVTSREVPVLHPCEHRLDRMSDKCSIYSHERWSHVESLLMKHGSMSLTQNHTVKSW